MVTEHHLRNLISFAENVIIKEPHLVNKLKVCRIDNIHQSGIFSHGIILDTVPCVPSQNVWHSLVKQEDFLRKKYLSSVSSPNKRHRSSVSSLEVHSNFKIIGNDVERSNENDEMMSALHYAAEYDSFSKINPSLSNTMNCENVQFPPLNLFPLEASELNLQYLTEFPSPEIQNDTSEPNFKDTNTDLKSVPKICPRPTVATSTFLPFTYSSQPCTGASQHSHNGSVAPNEIEWLEAVDVPSQPAVLEPHTKLSESLTVTTNCRIDRVNVSLTDTTDPLLLSRWPEFLWTRTHVYNLPCPQSVRSVISERDSVVILLVQATFRVTHNLALIAAMSLAEAIGKPLVALVSLCVCLLDPAC
jgi:hypothetical protein